MQRHWDIFCRVIDNYGDIGVCWRLARQLASEHGLAVRLWVDEPSSLKALAPALDLQQPMQHIDGVTVGHWRDNFAFGQVADVVIEAFACELPAPYIQAMAKAAVPPNWINLEYLTAESWADDCHGMASPHPALPLVKHFFFPGFSEKTGGLLRERTLLSAHPQAPSATETLEISLFCYETAPVASLLDVLATSAQTICCHVPPGQPLAAVKAHLGGHGPWQFGQLSVQPMPFLAQDDYDRLLGRCAINFVRGEDSFLRAQWAGKPFVWQIYPQDEGAHLIKLEAFLERYTAAFDAASKALTQAMFRAWNSAQSGGQGLADTWPAFLDKRAQLTGLSQNWRDRLAQHPDLASSLVNFCSPNV